MNTIEKIIATAFTGTMFIDGSEMKILYEYMEKKVGHGVIDLMLADKGFWGELRKACKQDFIDMVSKGQPEVFDTVAFQKGVAEGRRLEREEMPKWRNYGPNIIKDPFVTDLGSLVVGEKCIRIYELYNLPGFKND